MKPISLEMQAFGPFVEKQYIDFEKLSRDYIFLIKGKTGSGKTTIFDAITFALYGGGSGEGEKGKTGRNDIKEWRCTQAAPNAVTYVSFVFEVKGRKYRFTRKLVPKRVNLSAQYEAGEFNEDGEVIPFFNNPKENDLNEKAAEIIGLTKDQFRQVVLLPQGQFEKFLTAPSDEKEEILKKIFNAAQWEGYAQAVFDRAKKCKDALDEEKKQIENSLADEKLCSLDALREKIEEIRSKKDAAIEAHKSFDGERKQETLDDDIRLAEQFKPLRELEKKGAVLEQQKERIEKLRITYRNAEKAESYRGLIDGYEKCNTEYSKREKALTDMKKALPEKEAAVAAVEEEKKKHDEASPVAKLQNRIGEYRAKASAYESFSELSSAYLVAAKEYETAEDEYKAAFKKFDTAKAKSADLYSSWEKADRNAADYQHRYYAGIYGILADALTEGEKCPVCGSTHHPEPAVKAADSVSEAEMKERKKAVEDAKSLWERAEKARQNAEEALHTKSEARNGKASAKNRAEAELNAAKSQLIEGIADTLALEKAIKRCEDDIEAFKKKGEELDKKLSKAKREKDTCQSQIESARGELENARKERDIAENTLLTKLSENGYSDHLPVKAMLLPSAQRSSMNSEIVSYETSCRENEEALSAKRAELAGRTEPDSSKFAERHAEINGEKELFTKENAARENEITRLSGKLKALSEKEAHYSGEIRQAENDLAFARKLRGDTGIGLQRYVLAIMFNKVIDEANRMLRNVHDGRYRLFRSDDKGSGNKRGLELKVFDSRSPENKKGRSVAMLSGGEKFLVSLALSIGMSTVAQKSGVQIDALFIDEGFGTLDDDSIDDAINVLRGISRGSGAIGIISHVALLDSAINTKLEVIKSEAGSHIKAV